MPDYWTTQRGEEIASTITTGFTPKRQGMDYQREGVLFIRGENVRDGYLDISDPKFLPDDFDLTAKYNRLYSGDILVITVGSSIGHTCLFKFDDLDATVNQNVCVFRVKPPNLSEFVFQYFQAPHVRAKLMEQTTGSGRQHLSLTDFKKFEFAIPPLDEQCKIVEILSVWDKVIEKLRTLIDKKERRQRALTNSLVFGSLQLSEFRSDEASKKYRWFDLPFKWESKLIGELSHEVFERNADASITEVLTCTKHYGFVRSLEYFRKQVFSNDLTGYRKIWRGDFGFPSNHVEEGSIGLQELTDVGLVSPIYTVFRFDNNEIDKNFAIAVLKTSLYRHIFEVNTSASVDRRGSLRWREFSKIPFPVPPIAEQKRIAHVLKTQGEELTVLRKEYDIVQRQKRGLMQKLLTGDRRVRI